MAVLLAVRDLSVDYTTRSGGPVSALCNLHLELDAGEVVGIAGASGSGKSTLALAIVGALPANARVRGTIEYLGRGMAPVFQEPSGALHPMLTAGRQVSEALRARGTVARHAAAEARAALLACGLDEQAWGAWPHQLSGGQRQRVLLAQALAGGPDLLIADEPTASLDADAENEIIELLRDRNCRGAALLFITHKPPLLEALGARVLRMRNGRLS